MAEPQGVSWAPLVWKRAVEDLTARKRPAKDNLSSAAPERIRLKDHITESLVYDYKTMAKHSLKLTDFPFNVTTEEVQELCKDAVQIQHKGQLTRSPQLLHDKLNLHGVPEELRSKEKLSTFFPTRQMIGVLADVRIAMKLPSANELIKAVKDIRCWTIGVQDIRFTLKITKKDPAWARFKKGRKEGRELKKGKSLDGPGISGSQGPVPMNEDKDGPALMTKTKTTRILEVLEAYEDVMDGEKRPRREPLRDQAGEDSAKESHDEGAPDVDPSKPGPSMIQRMAEPQGVSWAPLVRKRGVEDLTARKRPAKDNLSSAAPERIRLKDHITESLVYDYKTMAKHSLKLTDFPFNVTAEEVQELCKDAVQIQHKVSHDCSLLRSTARYESEQRAVESAEYLQKATRKGTPFRVYYCGARWSQLTRSLQLLHKLNLHGVPEELRSKEKQSTFFPTRQMIGVLADVRIAISSRLRMS
ncbi:hypothetical protein V5799_025331 [Amblyomma americanum]|uniref:Uncharacterized protein n=1 Tax=Amblyomma americanum TaxID=6943 RepID=A0AAQ4E9K0_AMBAM